MLDAIIDVRLSDGPKTSELSLKEPLTAIIDCRTLVHRKSEEAF